jgi:hypothetical protein
MHTGETEREDKTLWETVMAALCATRRRNMHPADRRALTAEASLITDAIRGAYAISPRREVEMAAPVNRALLEKGMNVIPRRAFLVMPHCTISTDERSCRFAQPHIKI